MNLTNIGDLPVNAGATTNTRGDTARLSSAAKEFESVLLGQWLKDAESTFGTIPGSDQDDADGEQYKEFAMQHVATEITDRGGIGIAPIVERALAMQTPAQVAQSKGEGHLPGRFHGSSK